MNNASLELGGTNWAEKDGNILGYSVGDTSGNFSPQEFTFARGSNLSATRIDRAGLIVKGRENVLLQSNQFDTTWGNNNTTETSGQADKDGGTDAWLINSTSSFGSVIQGISSVSGVFTLSVYAKAGTNNWMLLRMLGSSNSRAWFDLENGVLGSTDGPTIESKIESVGGGWYRCSVTGNMTSFSQVLLYPTNANLVVGAVGNIYIQDSQVELGLAASPYIETTTTTAQAGVLENTPRLNYTTGVANPYLLLEPSRTNLFPQSEYFGGGDWLYAGAGTTSTINAAISPEGVQNAFKLIGSSNADNNGMFESFTISAGTEAYSFFAKAGEIDILQIGFGGTFGNTYANVNLTDGSLEIESGQTTTIEPYADGWYRISCVATATAGAGYWFVNIGDNPAMVRNGNYIGNGTDGLYLYGAQLEAGSYPTSYIPTYSVSATRAYDYTKFIDLQSKGIITASQGTLLIEMDNYNNGSVQFDVQNNNLDYALRPKFSSSDQNIFQRVNNVQTTVRTITGLPAGRRRCAISWNGTSLITSINGVSYTDTIDGSIAAELFKIDRPNFNGTIFDLNQLLMFSTQLTEAELNTLTTL